MKKNCIWGKRRRLPVILAACAAEVIVAVGVGQAGGAQRAASLPTQINPAAQALLDQSIQALGGQAFIDFKTMTSEGRVFSIADGVLQGFVHYTSAEEFPDRRRLSYGLSKKSKAVTLINNGDNGWELDRYGTIQQPQKEIRAWRLANRYSLENLLRLRIREPGMLIQMGKQDFVDNLPVQIVEMADARQAQIKLYLNISTHLPLQIGYRILDAQTHQWNEYSDIYSDYQTVQGTQTAMHIIRYLNGDRVAETFRSEVRYNETYPASFFGDQGGR
ncbi:MAG: hypothetical protein KGM47_12445 [Acidobacteriota bacterium]|nr:hypothetical protein [Acidobacteriota bacterium]